MSNKLVVSHQKDVNPPKCQDSYFFKLHVGYHAGMDIAEDKGKSQLFYTHSVEFYRRNTALSKVMKNRKYYKKNYTEKIKDQQGNIIYTFDHKKGDPKYVTSKRYKPLYSGILEAWKAAIDENPTYKQASTGMTHDMRNVFVIDYDSDEWSKYIDKWWTTLPMPTYMIENPSTHHAQIGYVLSFNEHYECYDWSYNENAEKEKYLEYGRKLNTIFTKLSPNTKGKTADTCFTSYQCKNPFYSGFKKIIWDETRIFSKEGLENTIDFLLNYMEIDDFNKKPEPEIKPLSIKPKAIKNFSHTPLETYTSRNNYEIKYFREAIWDFMRKNNRSPSDSEMWSMIKGISYDAARETGKETHDDGELSRILSCTGSWAIKSFKKINTYGKAERNLSNKIRKAQAFIKIIKVLNDEGTSRELAQKYNLSASTVSRYKNLTKKELNQYYWLAKEIIHYLKSFQLNEKYSNLKEQISLSIKIYKKFLNNQKENNHTNDTLLPLHYNNTDGTFSRKLPLNGQIEERNPLFYGYYRRKLNI